MKKTEKAIRAIAGALFGIITANIALALIEAATIMLFGFPGPLASMSSTLSTVATIGGAWLGADWLISRGQPHGPNQNS